jgi:hypothetical protein
LNPFFMPSPRRIFASLCLPLFFAAGVLCLCPHGASAGASDAAQAGCASHAGEKAPARSAPDHAPACPHCGGEHVLAAASPPESLGVDAQLAPTPAWPALALPREASAGGRSRVAPAPPSLAGRARLARHGILRI